jgi:gamma-glutamyltranspeptidase/glutathione hydrolase
MCGEYHGRVILSAAPPQTGLQVIHTLELLEPYDLRAIGLPTRSARAFDILTSAMRVGMTTARYGEDPNWADAPAAGVVAPAYVATRRALVGTGTAPERIAPASPATFDSGPTARCAPFDPWRDTSSISAAPGRASYSFAPGSMERGSESGETTHLSVVDADGNAVALTQTNSSTFGVGDRAAGGFMLNDSGNDLSRDSTTMSRLTSGRHPFRVRRSTISPTIVIENGRATMVIGAPGGGRIPTEILQNMVYILDYGLDPLEALRLPRIFPSATSRAVQLENGFPASVLGEIRAMGYEPTEESEGYARLYVIVRRGDRWIGAADPRHNGEVRGY